MRKRVLVGNKFVDYTGPEPEKAQVKSEKQKLQERAEHETTAAAAGFAPDNPAAGGLTAADKDLIKKGMPLPKLLALAAARKVVVPDECETKEQVEKFLLGGDEDPEGGGLTEADKEKVRAGISIPEMKKLAKERGVVIPKDVKKRDDVVAFLLDEGGEDEDEL